MASTGQLVTALEAAKTLGKSRRTILRMVEAGELPYVHKLDGRAGAYLFDAAVIDLLARRQSGKASA